VPRHPEEPRGRLEQLENEVLMLKHVLRFILAAHRRHLASVIQSAGGPGDRASGAAGDPDPVASGVGGAELTETKVPVRTYVLDTRAPVRYPARDERLGMAARQAFREIERGRLEG
jgi:hypothetical protein